MFKKPQSIKKLTIIGIGLLLFASTAFIGGMKYTDRSEFCSTCHVMEPMFDSWDNSAHKMGTSCNDCHAPAETGSKYIYKAISGAGHVYANVLGAPDNIQATTKSANIIQQNCLRCHGQMVEDTQMGGGKFCIDCHRSTPHGP